MNLLQTARRAVESMRIHPVAQHAHATEVAERTVHWARSLSLVTNDIEVSRARNIRVGNLAAYAFAREPLDVVQLGADLILWLFLFDDAIGEPPLDLDRAEHARTLQSYVDLLVCRRLPDEASHFHVALLDLVHRAVDLGASEDWLERFAEDMAGYFWACAEEVPYRRSGTTPPVAAYRDLRAGTVGTSAVFALIELGRSGIVPSDEMRRPEVVEARRIAALLTAWVNDVYSYPKETLANDPLNLVTALAAQYALEPTEALNEAVEVYNLELGELERLIDRILFDGCSHALCAYLNGLLDWVHGNRVWTKMCGRYT